MLLLWLISRDLAVILSCTLYTEWQIFIAAPEIKWRKTFTCLSQSITATFFLAWNNQHTWEVFSLCYLSESPIFLPRFPTMSPLKTLPTRPLVRDSRDLPRLIRWDDYEELPLQENVAPSKSAVLVRNQPLPLCFHAVAQQTVIACCVLDSPAEAEHKANNPSYSTVQHMFASNCKHVSRSEKPHAPVWGQPIQVSRLSVLMGGCRQVRLHHKGSAGVLYSSLEARTPTLREWKNENGRYRCCSCRKWIRLM